MASELKPCPFCGSDDLSPPIDRYEDWVTCKLCGAEGPEGNNAHEAITAWNRRTKGTDDDR